MKVKGQYADRSVKGKDFDKNWDRIFGTEEERKERLKKEREKKSK